MGARSAHPPTVLQREGSRHGDRREVPHPRDRDRGRDGEARSDDGRFAAKLSTPEELGGAGGDGTNPEQLFAAGYSACFIGALKAAGQQLKLKIPAETTVTATVGIGPRAAGGFGITADLEVSLPGLDHADAERLVAAAHQICPYSNATRNNVDVGLSLA